MRASTEVWERAVREFGIEPEPLRRPGVGRWLLYVLWRPLPDRHRTWVLFDATCSTWVLRHFARILVLEIVPTAVVALIIPASLGLRLFVALSTAAVAFALTAAWVNESTEQRLAQADWPWQFGSVLRERRAQLTAQARD